MSRTSRLLRVAAITIAFSAILGVADTTGQEASYEQKVEAVFIYEFTGYIDWPAGDSSAPFLITVLGDSEIALPLSGIARRKVIADRPIVVRTTRSTEEIGDSQVVFVSDPEALPEVLEHLRDRATLVVGASPGLAERGAGINFVLIDGRVRFEINRNALEEAGLVPSSQLLKLARIVGESR